MSDPEFVKSTLVERKLSADFDSLSLEHLRISVFSLCQLSFERDRALATPLMILLSTFHSMRTLQSYYGSSLSGIKPLHETKDEKDAMAQLLANGGNKLWHHDLAEWLDPLVRSNMIDCTLVLDKLRSCLMEIHKQSMDYKVDRGGLMLESSPFEPTIDDKDEADAWTTEYGNRITKAQEMETKLLHALQTAQDEIKSIHDDANRRKGESWMPRLELTEPPPPEASIVVGDVDGYLRRLSEPQRGDVWPMNKALEEIGMVAHRVGEKLHDGIDKAQQRLAKGRHRTLVDTLFMSDDEKRGFLIGVAERVAKIVRGQPSSVLRDRLVAELRATLYDVVGTPLWVIISLFDQCIDSAFGSSMELEIEGVSHFEQS